MMEILLSQITKDFEFSHWGITPLSKPLSIDVYENWLQENKHGEMQYLKSHLLLKQNPQLKFPFARSAIVFAQSYFPAPEKKPMDALRLAMYAQMPDYHHWLGEKLKSVIQILEDHFPGENFVGATDSQPILERDLAYRAGLGWFGKNTCIIHPKKGSLFFLAEILTSIECSAKPAPLPDFCGKCQRCMEVCPTGAIESPKHLDATKCISYWTIESKSVPPENLREKFGDHFFGCDLCQTVCPWNEKLFKGQLETKKSRELDSVARTEEIAELRTILISSNSFLEKKYFGTPLSRARGFGLKRNAIIVAANKNYSELIHEIQLQLQNEKLQELATWATQKLQNQIQG